MLPTTLGFNAKYLVERVDRPVPTGVQDFRTPHGAVSLGGISLRNTTKDIVLDVEPAGGARWMGRFWGGAEGLDGVFATPNPNVLCVVVQGHGYWVPVQEPAAFETIRASPVKRVLPVHDPAVLIFVSYTRLSAYGEQGFMWITEDVSWDGLKNLEVVAGSIRGVGWDSPAGCDVPFSADISTGKVDGGSSPARYRALIK